LPYVVHIRLARSSDPPRMRVGEVSEQHGVRTCRPTAVRWTRGQQERQKPWDVYWHRQCLSIHSEHN